jgi:hypothetical protein
LEHRISLASAISLLVSEDPLCKWLTARKTDCRRACCPVVAVFDFRNNFVKILQFLSIEFLSIVVCLPMVLKPRVKPSEASCQQAAYQDSDLVEDTDLLNYYP